MRKLPWPSTSLGMHLQQAWNACQCTQRTIAQQAHVSPPTLRLLEHGQGNLTSFWAVLHTLNLDIVGRNLPPGPHIGERILTWRQRKGMSQRELSQFVGVSPPTLLAWERARLWLPAGIRQPVMSTLSTLPILRDGTRLRRY